MISKQSLFSGLTAVSLLIPLISFAETAAFDNGFYIGAKLGAQQAMASWTQTNTITFTDIFEDVLVTSNVEQDGTAFHTNFMGNAAIGYGRVMERFFLAAEFSVNLAEEQEFGWQDTQTVNYDSSATTSTLYTDTTVKLENPDIILDLRPGWLIAPNFLLYGRLGVAYNKLSLQQNTTIDLFDSFQSVSETFHDSTTEKKDVYAWRVGLGMEYKFNPNLGMNIDYVFTDYGSIDPARPFCGVVKEPATQIQATNSCLLLDSAEISSSAEVTKSTATIGFNWYFGG